MSLLLAALLAAAPAPVAGPEPIKQQSYMNASDLRELCRPKPGLRFSDDPGKCRAYLLGAADSVRTVAVESGIEVFCTPRGVTADRLVAAFTAYLARHPQYDTNTAASVVTLAMEDAFPCKAPRGGRP